MARASRRLNIPAYALYGEAQAQPLEMLHIEAIRSRSQRHQWEIDAHMHHGLYQLLWVASGRAEVALEGLREVVHGPVAIVIPPGVVHAFRFSRDTEGHVLTFHPQAVVEGDLPATGEALRQLFAGPRMLRFDAGAATAQRLAALFNALNEEFAAADAPGSPVPQWLARAVVWGLAQQVARPSIVSGRSARTGSPAFTRFIVLVEAHYREHWPVSRYADRLGLTPEGLNRLTRAETGRSALDLVHDRLTREAGRRLTYVAVPISRLAFELGFRDPAYFCRFFKRRTGRSPSDHRRATAGTAAE